MDPCPLNDLERILLATDGSGFSEGAIKEAISLADQCHSRLTAMEVVVANQEFAAEAPQLVEKEELEARRHLESVQDRATAARVDCRIVVHEGDSAHALIVDEARNGGDELIVMGRRGRSGIMKVTMGSETARVIGHAPCDVLVVPRDCSLEFNNILVATDGSAYGDAALQEAITIARKCGGSLTALSVAASESRQPAAAEIADRARRKIEAAGIPARSLTASGKPYVRIVEAASREDADLIVMGCHGRGGLAKLLMGSVTERVIGNAPCAVLVARALAV